MIRGIHHISMKCADKVLFEKGLISEQERNQMIHQINHRHNAAR